MKCPKGKNGENPHAWLFVPYGPLPKRIDRIRKKERTTFRSFGRKGWKENGKFGRVLCKETSAIEHKEQLDLSKTLTPCPRSLG